MIEHDFSDELIQDYLAESREHLGTIENDLLAIEQAGSQIDEQLVNRVFRAAHSIKGGAGFFGLTVIRELAHKTENVLDLIRSRQITPNSEMVSILLLAFDKLRELVDDYANSNQSEIAEFVTALTAVATSHLPESQRDLLSATVALETPTARRLIEVSAFDLDQARRGGKWIYLIRYDLFHDFDRRGKTPLSALRTLIKCGTILETAIDLQSAGSLEDDASHQLLMEVLYATVLEKDIIGDLVEVKADQIQVIERNGSFEPLKKPESAVTVPATAPEVPTAPLPSPAPAPPPIQATAPQTVTPSPTAEATIRLNVGLLDSLMTLAGELVLSRNELNEAVSHRDHQGIETAAHRLSLVTSELQEAVALTRMQPVGTVFAKFPRVVRELARALGKEIDLQMEGGDVEVDKTILEGLSDPLTHMVRNSVDHGIETPEQRLAAGKPVTGTVTLSARHQAGQVVIEIADDGRGLSADRVMASCVKKGLITQEQASVMTESDKMALIFLPGSSTAEKVSDVSGRGVGMDVVKTNLDKLGGKIEIESAAGRGTSFRIKLPLTLAIMPSLLVSENGERFAIPQTSVGELIRIPAAQRAERINHAGGAEVLLLRDRLVPLLHLSDALEIPDRGRAEGAWNIVLVGSGTFEYGLVVEELHDTVEIVVKPLGRHLQAIRDYAGATILGDGRVAPIIDVELLASRAGLTQTATTRDSVVTTAADKSSLLLFFNAPSEPCALPIELVTRIESVEQNQIEYLGGRRTFQYRGASLPLVSLHDIASVGQLDDSQDWKVIIVERNGGSFGLLAAGPLDMIETALSMDAVTLRQTGVAGSAILNGNATLILEIVELAETALGRQEPPPKPAVVPEPGGETVARQPMILVAEDSEFFRKQITKLIEAVGYRVLPVEDGQAAWEALNNNSMDVSVVVTDLEMPRLDGLALTRQIRADKRFAGLPIIALSALAGEEEIERGLAMGVTEYQVKLDQDQLLDGIRRALQGRLQ
ncbi:MAG: chemotaxis protein CheW [Bryobacteraceae bacterium]